MDSTSGVVSINIGVTVVICILGSPGANVGRLETSGNIVIEVVVMNGNCGFGEE